MRIIRSVLALALLVGGTFAVQAAGLGKLTVNSALGQVLNAEIDLVSLQGGEADTISARVAAPEAFRDARIEYSPALRLLRFSVEKHNNGTPYLKVTSIGPINEPFIDALIEVTWPSGRLQREYPILLDPPGYAQAKVNAPAVAAAPAPAPVAPSAPAKTTETPPAAEPAAPPSATGTQPANPPTTGAGPSAAAELPAGASASDTYGPIEKGETLSKIAGQVKPADVSLEQMLVALYRENKEAFSGNNMNRLKTGQILKIPSAEEVGAIAQKDARAEIHTQVQDWNSYREQLAGASSASISRGSAEPSSGSNSASGRVTSAAVTPPPVPSPPSSDTLRISKSESASGKAAAGKASQERLNSLQEELTAKNKALQESQSRVADLEKQIRDMQRLLDLKGGAAATKPGAQVAAVSPPAATAPASTKPAETKPAETKPEPPKVAAATPPKPEPAKPAEPAKVTPAPAGAQSPETKTPEPPKVAEATPPKPAQPKAAPPKPAPKKVVVQEKSFVDELMENPAYLAGGVGAIALIAIAGFIVSRRRRSRADGMGENSQMTSAFPSDLKPGANTSKPAAGLVDTGNSSFLTDFDKTGPGTIDTDEVDPVAEAEVYIAYGRDAQAEEILKEAMARDKSRHEIALKLLEIYHARKSATAYETVAKELRNAVGEQSPLWQKAAAMGAQIDPSNPLYGSAAGGMTATYTAMAPSAPAPSPAKPELDFDIESGGGQGRTPSPPVPSFDLDLDSQKHAEPASHESAPASSGLDFDLAPSGGSAPPPRMDMSSEPVKEDKPAFDFDLSGLDMGKSSGSDTADINLEATSSGAGGEAVGTKLELAKAYLEIGDKDGAREILHEVAKEGSSAQKEEAKKLIASL